tara:strand:- start:24 stop:1220 length:1197 start_codon:yes stop_codon:yes gene_type:complete
MACPGSVVLEAAYPDKSSIYADEGTAAHTLAAFCLTDNLSPETYISEVIHVGSRQFTVDKTMAGHIANYVKFVRELAEGNTLLVERKVPIGHLTGEGGATGTADTVIIKASERNLTVVDLKYGMGVQVDASENPQLQMYALGAYEAYGVLADFDTVSMYIHMPRLNYVGEYHISVAELLAFGEDVKLAAYHVGDAQDTDLTTEPPSEYLRPGEKQCRFCKAKATCPALLAEVSGIVGGEPATAADFAQFLPIDAGEGVGDNYLSVAMDKVGLVEDWCKAVRAETERRLLQGMKVPGYKLVEGKQGNRAWVHADKAEEALKAMRLKQDEMYDKKLISPTAAEKLLKTKPDKWQKLEELITRAPGKPSVALATDKRPELAVHTATAEEFAALANTEYQVP